MESMAIKTKAVIWGLIAVIVVLAAILVYAFVVSPAISSRQQVIYGAGINEGQSQLLNALLTQIQQNGYVQIPLANNQSVFLAPFDPQQVAQQ